MLFVSALAIRHGFEANNQANARMARNYDLMLALAEMEAGVARRSAAEDAVAKGRAIANLRASRKSLALELQAEQRSSALRDQIARLCLGFTALVALSLLAFAADQLRREVAHRRRSEAEAAAARDEARKRRAPRAISSPT
jgi:hypothetical protein